MTRPRAPQPAPSPGNRNIKEGCSSHTVGRGVGAKNEEGKGGTRPLGKRQGPQIGHQETGTSLERARPGLPEVEEGAQDGNEGREGVKDTFQDEGRPGTQVRKRLGEKQLRK